MKNLLFVIIFLGFISCKKGDLEISNLELGVDPAVNMDMVNQLLQLEGKLVEGNLPPKSKPLIGSVFPILLRDASRKIDTININYDMPIFIPFNIPNMSLYKIRTLQFKLNGSSSYWKVPFINDTGSTDFAFSLIIPRLIKPTSLRLDFNAELFASAAGRRDSCVTDSGSIFLIVSEPLPCPNTISGTFGITQRRFILGNNAGKVKLKFNTGGSGDRMDVRYNNQFILSTCPPSLMLKPWQFPKCKSPGECFLITRVGNLDSYKEFTFDYDPAKSNTMDVFVTGFCTDPRSLWQLTVECP